MDSSRLKDLKRCTQKVVNRANRPGGSLETGEFTMGLARRLITEEMGLQAGELDTKEWKGVVKGLVNDALENLDEGGPSQASPAEKEKIEIKAKTKAKPESVSKAKPGTKETSPQKSREPDPDSPKVADDSGPAEVGHDSGHESDMSSVYDVAPVPKRRKSGESGTGAKEKVNKEKRPKKDVDEGLSPDEGKIAELKRIVVACGVRKQWAKEFADCPSPSSQIRHLHSLLSSLGMKGTPTTGKAKALKEKRELAAELDEVREFEAKRGVNDLESEERASRSKDRATTKPRRSVVQDDVEEEDARPKGTSALDSVLDFLGDQSD